MSAFTGPLRLEHQDARWRNWILLDPLEWEVGAPGSGHFVVVPAGFETDGASIPQALWWLLPSTGRYMRPAALHDYLCVLLHAGTPHAEAPSRKAADREFLAAMRAVGVRRLVRWTLFLAVRAYAILKGL